uniref:5-hydroxytryptamine receptor 3A-like n=1 Tax=Semicossyphus pulcher TaxID=241346 RepID=UPI0037E7091E
MCNRTYQDIIAHLNLTSKKDLSMTRPAKNAAEPTEVELAVLLYAILEVKEKEQEFVSYVWVDLLWVDNHIQWIPGDFCGIQEMCLPTGLVWKPDLTIEEMTEKDKATQSPYFCITYLGKILLREDMVLITTCKMQVYKFPFDFQRCNLSFKSVIHDVRKIMFVPYGDSNSTTQWSQEKIRTQSDWLFINITLNAKTVHNFEINQSMIVYTITMKRRSVLYIVNFILPILMFLGLDLSSFLISERGGEKLSFKVTVLLAVTVMQLILNEILPSSSDRIPLIAIYCIGIFGLMMLSLLETILVMFLMEKDSASQDNEEDKDQGLSCDASSGDTSSELMQVAKEGRSSRLTEESLDSLKEEMKSLSLSLSSKKKQEQTGYWTRMAKKLNNIFFLCYVITTGLFLSFMFYSWAEEENEKPMYSAYF